MRLVARGSTMAKAAKLGKTSKDSPKVTTTKPKAKMTTTKKKKKKQLKAAGKENGDLSSSNDFGQQSFDDFMKHWDEDEDEGQGQGRGQSTKDSSGGESDGESDQKDFLSNLPQKDPEFYKFLQENDQELLNFDDEESEEDDREEGVHQIPDSLEVASDDSDFDEEGEEEEPIRHKHKLTAKKLNDLERRLKSSSVSVSTVEELAQVLKASVESLGATGEVDKKKKSAKRKVALSSGSAAFNAAVRLCVTRAEPAFLTVLKLDAVGPNLRPQRLTKSKKWAPLNRTLKSYTMDLIKLLSVTAEETAVSVLLKHCHAMIPFYAALPKSAKHLVQRLIQLWSSSDTEPVRVLAFLSLLKLTRLVQSTMLQPVIKGMYLAYVRNCRFTSPAMWPLINFMRRSLSEVFALDPRVGYSHAFVYIRQLSISLRNAVNASQKKDTVQAVYNWQFVHSVHLWAHLLSSTHPNEAFSPLIFPLVQIIEGTIKLVYTSKYLPLRFHLCRILSDLSSQTGTFVSVLPHYLDVLANTFGSHMNKKLSKASMKPLDFGCILKLSKSQLLEGGSKDAAIEGVYGGVLAYLSHNSHKIAFPELAVPVVMQLREFLKRCKVANYCRKMKQLLEKIEENSKFLLIQRGKVTFGVMDTDKFKSWEAQVSSQGTPLSKFYSSWVKVKEEERKRVKQREAEDKDYDFIPRPTAAKKRKLEDEEDDFKGLLDSDDSDSMDDEERFKLDDEDDERPEAAAEQEPVESDDVEEEESEDEDEDILEDLSANEFESSDEDEV